MPDVRREISLPPAPLDSVFQSGLRALTDAGFALWKTRPLGWFAIARRGEGAAAVEANLSVRGGEAPMVSLGLSAEGVSEDDLAGLALEILEATTAASGRS